MVGIIVKTNDDAMHDDIERDIWRWDAQSCAPGTECFHFVLGMLKIAIYTPKKI